MSLLGWTLLCGAGFGAGLVLMLRSLFPRPEPLGVRLARTSTPAAQLVQRRPASELIGARLGADRIAAGRFGADLRLVGRSPASVVTRSVAVGLAGLLAGPVMGGLLAALGAGVTLTGLPLVVSVALGGIWATIPWVALRTEAKARRRDIVHGLSAFMDLVALSVAAGRGVEMALDRAAASGQGPAFDVIRASLGRSRNMGESVWAGLGRLGAEMGVADLEELAASVGLAGEEGAKVRESLLAKARSLRFRLLSEVQDEASSAGERLAFPVSMLLFGFLLFLGYPAVAALLS